jgi:polysaccharide deacetylase family protein (PEP-CTERM system associated)
VPGARPEGSTTAPVTLEGEYQAQIERSTQMLLDLLRSRNTRATFFVVGEIAERQPGIVEAILAEGHELGCHGFSHRPLWEMNPDEFRLELRQFARVLRDIAPGVPVTGFRAPTFSLDNRTRWALPVLAEFGYDYDSSVFPLQTPLYGVNGCPLTPYRPSQDNIAVAEASGSLLEFPMSVWAWGRVRLPVCGGFYLRALPLRLVHSCLRQINRQRPFVIYIHPWETYPGTPRLPLPWGARFATYYNIGKMQQRFVTILDTFAFAPMRAVLEEMGELSG